MDGITRIPEINECIGFDLGHGETAIARCSTLGGGEPEIMELFGERNQITAIGYRDSGGPVIGWQALRQSRVTAIEICFKGRPNKDFAHRQTVGDYFTTCHRHLIDSRQITDPEHTRFYVGCPSAWSREDIDAYGELLRGTGAAELEVVRESRAALMHAVETRTITLRELRGTLLVIDIGSSTTDFTQVLGSSREEAIDYGSRHRDLGASTIDKAILAHSLARHPQRAELEEIFSRDPRHRARFEVHCRKLKEAYFNNPDDYDDPDGDPCSVGTEDIQNRYFFKPVLGGAIVREILAEPLEALEGRGWAESFEADVREARLRMEEGGTRAEAVILTGGASRMRFIGETVARVFPELPEGRIIRDSEPQFCIARGLARWGRTSLRMAAFTTDIAAVCDGALASLIRGRLPELIERVSGALAPAVSEGIIRQTLIDWREGRVDTLNDLGPAVERSVAAWMKGPEALGLVVRASDEWMQPIQDELFRLTTPICQRYHVPAGALKLAIHVEPGEMRMDDLAGNDPTGAGMGAVIGAGIGAVIIANLIGGGGLHLFFLGGPNGLILGFVIGAIVMAMGYEAFTDWMKGKSWPLMARRMALSEKKIDGQLESKLPELTARMREGFLARDRETRGEWTATLTEQIGAQLKRALLEKVESARLVVQ